MFTPPTTSEVRTIILKCPNKSCNLEPFPTFLLKRCIDQLIHPITTTLNMSMRDGVVPDGFKQALINPLILKTLKNYFQYEFVFVVGIGNGYSKSSP